MSTEAQAAREAATLARLADAFREVTAYYARRQEGWLPPPKEE
jgi:hypothetical protein